MYYLILLVFFLSFVAFIYFSFQVHFCSIFPHLFTFLAFFFFRASNESIMCFICMLLFSVLSLPAFCKSSEKTVKTIQTIGKTQIPFDFAVVLFWSSASKFALFLPTLPSLSFYRQSSNPKTNHVPRALSYSSTKRTLRTTLPEASRRSAIHIFLVKVSIRFTCWRRSLNWLHHQHHCCLLPLTSSLLCRRHRHQAT